MVDKLDGATEDLRPTDDHAASLHGGASRVAEPVGQDNTLGSVAQDKLTSGTPSKKRPLR